MRGDERRSSDKHNSTPYNGDPFGRDAEKDLGAVKSNGKGSFEYVNGKIVLIRNLFGYVQVFLRFAFLF